MSLLSTDISRVKRFSVREIKLPTPEVREIEPIQPTTIKSPPSDEAIAYSKLLSINPALGELVDRLNLVSEITGERIEVVETIEPHPEPEIKEIDKPKLIDLADRIIEGENNYSREDIIERIMNATKVTRERAERGLNLIIQTGIIKETLGSRYYLTASTPF